MTNQPQYTLVCPNCGSDRLATRERAEIWQPATFTRIGGETDIDWEAYDSEDVGDTETVGWACRECQWTGDKIDDELVTEDEFALSHVEDISHSNLSALAATAVELHGAGVPKDTIYSTVAAAIEEAE